MSGRDSSLFTHHSSLQNRDCRTVPPFIFVPGSKGLDRRMLAQMLAHGLAQRAGAEAVDDADGLLALEERAVEELVGGVEGVVDALSDEIQFGLDFLVRSS